VRYLCDTIVPWWYHVGAVPASRPDRAAQRAGRRVAARSGEAGPRGLAARLSGWLGRNGWLVAIAAAYLYVFPYFPGIRSANELPRVYLTRAIVEQQTFALDDYKRRWGDTSDLSPSGGHVYANKAPGSSLLAVPVFAAVRAVTDPGLATSMWICRVGSGIAPAVAFLALLSRFLSRFSADPATRRLVVVAYALGSLAMTYAMLFYSHQLAAVCIASAWILVIDVVERRRGLVAMAVAGALAGCAPLVDYQAALPGVPIAVWMAVRMARWPRGELVRALAAGVAGAAVPIAILLAYHTACFGAPLRTGYAASQVYAADHASGLLGATYPKWGAFVHSTVALDKGLFAFAPWLLLVVPGTVVLWRRGERGIAAVGAAVVAVMLAFISSLAFWHAGWEVGPRYVTAMLPFALPAIVAAVDACRVRGPWWVAAAAAPMLVGIVIYVVAAATFPYWPEVDHPLYDCAFRLLGDGLVSPSIASWLGASGIAGVIPYFALCAAVTGWAVVRVAGVRGAIVAAAVAAVWIAAYGAVPHGGDAADGVYHRLVALLVERG
jgi:hypothetical protein